MTAVKFLWFIGVLALVSTSEARLGYTKNKAVKGATTVYYKAQGAREIYTQIRESLTAKYHVASELTVPEITALTTELVTLIRNSSSETIQLIFINLNIDGLELTGMKVSNPSFVIRCVGINSNSSDDSLRLTIMVPEVRTTFSSKYCEIADAGIIPSPPIQPCTLVYTFRKVRFDLEIFWPPQNMGKKPYRASITSYDSACFMSKIWFRDGSHDKTYRKGDYNFAKIIDRIGLMMPDQSRAEDLLKRFAHLLVL